MKAKPIPGVPLQRKGSFHDTESRKEYNVKDIDRKFDLLKQRFFSINQWKYFSGNISADFKHFNSDGESIGRFPKKGDFIRINLSGAKSELKQKEHFDWVRIVNISHNVTSYNESYLIACRPSAAPDKPNGYVEHFYACTATSSFIIVKENVFIKTGIHGRNETPNYNALFIDKIRNFFIAVGGMLGIAKIQWKLLADGLLDF
jgi:hypothetical protein